MVTTNPSSPSNRDNITVRRATVLCTRQRITAPSPKEQVETKATPPANRDCKAAPPENLSYCLLHIYADWHRIQA